MIRSQRYENEQIWHFIRWPKLHLHCSVKLVYKGHSKDPENVAFIYRLKLYAIFIDRKNETALYRQ